MKRRLSRLAAFALTLVAVCAMVIVPASADDDPQETVTFNKTLDLADGAVLPAAVTYSYSIEGSDGGATGSSFSVTAGPVTDVKITETVTFPKGTNADATQRVTVTFPEGTFTVPGIYRYKITETGGGLPGFSSAETTEKYLDVVVTAGTTGLECSSYIFPADAEYNDEGDAGYSGKNDGFTDTFTTHDFGFSKAVDGNAGDHNKPFEFTLNITGALPGTYTVTATDIVSLPDSVIVDEETGTMTITIDDSRGWNGDFGLKHGSSFSIAGLNDGAVCAVSEVEDGYEASYKVNSGGAVTGNSYPETALTADTTVDFTNTRTMTVPTGVLLTIAPFAVGLFLFGALAVFFVARKRQYEE